jgi:hypothetical protein
MLIFQAMPSGSPARDRSRTRGTTPFRKLGRHAGVVRLLEENGGARQGVHPAGEIMKVLAVAVPLQGLVQGLAGSTLR